MANRYDLSADEIRSLAGWPDALIDDYLSMIDRLSALENIVEARASISSAGVSAGEGLNVSRTSVGVYKVAFSTKRSNVNYIISLSSSVDNAVCNWSSKTSDGFTVSIRVSGVLT